jgi:hypothetical protein
MSAQEERFIAMLRAAELIAAELADGHVTIMRFTTGWKIMLGTPEMTLDGGYDEVGELPGFESLEAALEHFTKAVYTPRYSIL